MLTLVAEIRRTVAEKRTDGLLPKVEELLRLKPDHPQAPRWPNGYVRWTTKRKSTIVTRCTVRPRLTSIGTTTRRLWCSSNRFPMACARRSSSS